MIGLHDLPFWSPVEAIFQLCSLCSLTTSLVNVGDRIVIIPLAGRVIHESPQPLRSRHTGQR